MKIVQLLLGIVLGAILASGLIVCAALILIATGSLWLMAACYVAGTVGFAFVGLLLARYIDQR
jgi:hypothetical protein